MDAIANEIVIQNKANAKLESGGQAGPDVCPHQSEYVSRSPWKSTPHSRRGYSYTAHVEDSHRCAEIPTFFIAGHETTRASVPSTYTIVFGALFGALLVAS
jgi:hypothetical protein